MADNLLTIRTAVSSIIQEPSVTDDAITSTLNRGLLEIAGGANRGYDVPTLPPLDDLSTIFEIDTVPGSNSVAMPDTYQRWALYGYSVTGDKLDRFDSFHKFNDEFSYDKSGNVHSFCVVGRTLHYVGSPASAETMSFHGYRFPVDMVSDSDTPDGLPAHLAYRLLVNYASMEFFSSIEQDIGGPGYNFQKHSSLYSAALKDLNDFLEKDQPDEYVHVDDSRVIGY